MQYDFKVARQSAFVLGAYNFTSKHNIPTAAQDSGTVLYEAAEKPVPQQESLNLRGGIKFGSVEATAFVNNVFNQLPETRWTYYNLGTQWNLGSTPRPRTVGLAFVYRSR